MNKLQQIFSGILYENRPGFDYGTTEKYYKYENIEISGKIVNVNSIFDSLIKKELLIPVAAFRNKRIDEILED